MEMAVFMREGRRLEKSKYIQSTEHKAHELLAVAVTGEMSHAANNTHREGNNIQVKIDV